MKTTPHKKEYMRQWRERNYERCLKRERKYNAEHVEILKEKRIIKYRENHKKITERLRVYRKLPEALARQNERSIAYKKFGTSTVPIAVKIIDALLRFHRSILYSPVFDNEFKLYILSEILQGRTYRSCMLTKCKKCGNSFDKIHTYDKDVCDQCLIVKITRENGDVEMDKTSEVALTGIDMLLNPKEKTCIDLFVTLLNKYLLNTDSVSSEVIDTAVSGITVIQKQQQIRLMAQIKMKEFS
jgi:hypothetical protein